MVISQWMRSIGGAGAVANAARACEDRVRAEAAVDGQLARIAPAPVAMPVVVYLTAVFEVHEDGEVRAA